MSMRISPPDFKKSKSYERYKTELLAWREITELKKEKQGIAIALSLPEDDSENIREKVFDDIPLEDLKKEDGLDTLIAFLDDKLGVDDLADSLEKFELFEDYTREKGQSVAEFISQFDMRYNKILKKKMSLPAEILAFKLLKKANITKEQKLLVLTGMDYSSKSTLYEQAKKSLKKFLGEQLSASSNTNVAVKLEPTFFTENEEALLAAGYVYQGATSSRRGRGRYSGRVGWRNNGGPSRGVVRNDKYQRQINPTGANGKILTCLSCGSFRHMIANCPDSWENLGKVNLVENKGNAFDNDNIVLFTGSDKSRVTQLGCEARNCVVLDSACSSTVCGQSWLSCYLQSIAEKDKEKVKCCPSVKVFQFGGGEKLNSKASYHIPAVIAGQEITIITDVVESNIPLLLSLKAMKNAKVKLNLENDTVEILGKSVALNNTTSGHYCLPLDNTNNISVEQVCAVNLKEIDSKERYKALLKLHRQFAHPPERKLTALLKDAGVWEDHFKDDLVEIQQKCQLCKRYAQTPPRPAVSLPMATSFNQKVAMDLKKWNDKWILHLVDMWSRLTVSVFIERKKSSEVIDKIMLNWIGGAGFGVMGAILTDNGGEFNSDEMREVASMLNVNVITTAAESPFQNGLCERIHSVTDMMLLKLTEEYPKTPLNVLLCWANMARNSLQMWHGYSSYQLVFGKNPNLPNIMTDNIPALQGKTSSEVLANHLNVLHATRRAFIESECSERIRRALRCKIRASEQKFVNGELVYYKREGQEKWLGPGKVVFQDGKVIFVRHGGVFVRVSPNRLIKAGENINLGDNEEGSADVATSKDLNSGYDQCKRKEDNIVFEEIVGNNDDNDIEVTEKIQNSVHDSTKILQTLRKDDKI